MKLHRLDLTGFGPFLETQTVDFDAFDDDGVFLISGRTGAGKSSILDGVSFALYGAVPRYDGGERRLRSDHCAVTDVTEVRLEFTVGDRRWRVTRAPDYERPAKRGGGMTTEPARAELEERVGDQWIGRAAKLRDVGLLLDEIVGLNAQQFQQVILLAQNKFSRFLLADNTERQALLRTLFGTRRFEQYKNDLDDRRREAQKELEAAGARAHTLLEQAERVISAHALRGSDEVDAADDAAPVELAARREAAQRSLLRAEYHVEQAEVARDRAAEEHAAAAAAHADLTARAQRGRERDEARTRLAGLEQRAAQIDADRTRLRRARLAESLRAPLESAHRAAAEWAAADEGAAAAERRWREAGAGTAPDDIAGLIESLTGDLARWQSAAETERELVSAIERLAAAERTVTALTAELSALEQQQAAVPLQRERLEEQLADARQRAARHDDLRSSCATLTAQTAAAREAVALDAEVAAAEATYAAASAAASAAAERVTTLLQRRLAGYAGELAAALVDGEPCTVCGSREHPHAAAPAADAVTDDDLAAAEAERDEAIAAERRAAELARGTRETRAAARERAGGRSIDDLQASLAEAERDAAVAAAAVDEAARIIAERDELVASVAVADEEKQRLETDLAAAHKLHVAQQTIVNRQRAEVDAARGDFDSVADRIAAAVAERDRARAVAEARAALGESFRAMSAAFADRNERLATTEFATEAAAEAQDGAQADAQDDAQADAQTVAQADAQAAAAMAALLPESDRRALDAGIAAHAAELTAVRARLLELELDTVDLDVSDADLAEAATALADTGAARDAAIAAHRDAMNTAERLRDLLVQTDDACGEVSTVARETAVIIRLADTVAGRAPNTMKMDLETFVLAAELEEIVAAANLRLAEMSSGRYTLHHSDAKASRGRASGLGIEVLDAHTGRLRSPHSLSGGETFLASLALALGLAEVVTSRAGGLRLDTLFVDEGFGSLDPETLELAMRTLDELRAGGRTIGLISHVEAMKEQLPAQVVVTATPEGPSVIGVTVEHRSAVSAASV